MTKSAADRQRVNEYILFSRIVFGSEMAGTTEQYSLILFMSYMYVSFSHVRPLEFSVKLLTKSQIDPLYILRGVVQTVGSLIADPGIVSTILARPYTFVEIYHKIFSMVIGHSPPADLKKGCCNLQAKV